MKLKLKPFKQTPGYCGPASLKIVLKYYGYDYSELKLARLMNSNRKKGWSEEAVANAARKIGMNAYYKNNSSIEELTRLNKEGIPVIVGWFAPESAFGHYSVVKDINKYFITLADPRRIKERKLPLWRFKLRWFDLNNTPPKSKRDLNVRPIVVVMQKKK